MNEVITLEEFQNEVKLIRPLDKSLIEAQVSADEAFMRLVYIAASRSKDPSTKIGAVLVKDGNVFSTGYNGFGRNISDFSVRWNDRPTKYKFVCHAEFNAIMNAARHGHSTLGATIYTQDIPCNECMKGVVQAGISKIICHTQWRAIQQGNEFMRRWNAAQEISKVMSEEADIKIEWIDKVLGVEGLLAGSVISV